MNWHVNLGGWILIVGAFLNGWIACRLFYSKFINTVPLDPHLAETGGSVAAIELAKARWPQAEIVRCHPLRDGVFVIRPGPCRSDRRTGTVSNVPEESK